MDASYCLCVLLFGKQIHEPISLQGDTFLWFYPVFLSSCSVMLSRCASRGEGHMLMPKKSNGASKSSCVMNSSLTSQMRRRSLPMQRRKRHDFSATTSAIS